MKGVLSDPLIWHKMESDYIPWSKIEFLSKILASKIKKTKKNFQSISTVSRGGLVPSRILADILDINEILVDQKKIPEDSIFVDDIFDSGSTFRKIIGKTEDPDKLVFATLFARKGKRYPKQLLYAAKTQGNEYIVYPWDKLEYSRMKKYQK